MFNVSKFGALGLYKMAHFGHEEKCYQGTKAEGKRFQPKGRGMEFKMATEQEWTLMSVLRSGYQFILDLHWLLGLKP